MRQLFLSFFLLVTFQNATAQSFVDRFNFQVGLAGHGINRANEVGTLSFAFHPYFRFNKNWSIALRYDHHIHQFGSRNHRFTSPNQFWVLGSDLRHLNSLTLSPEYRYTLFDTDFSIATGIGYFQFNPVPDLRYSNPQKELINTYWSERSRSVGLSITLSAYFQKFHSGLIINYFKKPKKILNTDMYFSVFMNYNILTQKKNVFFNKENKKNGLPKFSINFGIQPMGNLGKYAGTFNAFIEPQYFFKKNISIGFRINSKSSAPVGYDKEGDYYFQPDNLNPTYIVLRTHNTQTMEKVYARLLTSNYYFEQKNGWYFANVGVGIFNRKSSPKIEGRTIDNLPKIIEAIPHQRNPGFFIGGGFKTGFFRFSIEYNLTGKGIPDYLAMQMGVDIAIIKNKN